MITDGFACTVTNALQAVTIHNKVLNSVQMSSDDSDGLIMNKWMHEWMNCVCDVWPTKCGADYACRSPGFSYTVRFIDRLHHRRYELLNLNQTLVTYWLWAHRASWEQRTELILSSPTAVIHPRRCRRRSTSTDLPACFPRPWDVRRRPTRQTDRRPRR